MPIKITVDDKKMRRFIRQMPKATNRAVARSLNKAITRARTQAARKVSEKRNIKVGRARDDMRLVKASTAKPEAMIVAKGAPIRVMEVKGVKRQTKRGVTAKITAGEKPHLFESAFIARTKSGHVGVFVRTGNSRLPIREVSLPSVAATMVQEKIDQELHAFAVPVYEAELLRLIELEMQRAGGR